MSHNRFPASRFRHSGLAWAMVSMCATTVACGGGKVKEPKTLPAQTVSQVTPALEPPPPLPPPQRRTAEPAPREITKVIDPGDDSENPKTLVEASRLAKARKSTTPPSVVEINDENLHEYAEGAQVILMESGPAAPPPVSAPPRESTDPLGGSSLGDPGDEQYWRERGLSLRRSLRRSFDEIERVELEAAAQRQRFYAEDDPYVRDAQIKPAWDRALDRLSELRDEADRYEVALQEFLDEGRAFDIPVAWLNDGWELEPDEEERRAIDRPVRTQDAIDTPILEDPARDVDSDTRGGGR